MIDKRKQTRYAMREQCIQLKQNVSDRTNHKNQSHQLAVAKVGLMHHRHMLYQANNHMIMVPQNPFCFTIR